MTATQAWVVRAGREDDYARVALERGVVGVGWSRVGDLSEVTSSSAVRARVADAYPHEPAAVRTLYALQLHAFRSAIQPGHLVVLLHRNSPDVAVGEVTGNYRYETAAGPSHVRAVNWLQPRLRRSELGSNLLAVPALAAVSRLTRSSDRQRVADAAKGIPPTGSAEVLARAESPVDNLRRNLAYAKDLAGAGRHLEGLGVTAFEFRDVYRAAWVQAVAAMDHWVRQEITARTLVLLKNPDLPRPPTFGRILGKPPVVAKLAQDESAFRSAMETKLAERHAVFQNPAKIYAGLEDVADVTALWARVAAVLDPPIAPGDFEVRLAETVARRNVIAHRYDEDPHNPPYKKQIDVGTTMAAIDFIDQVTAGILLVVDGS